jgi:hypothetical protein
VSGRPSFVSGSEPVASGTGGRADPRREALAQMHERSASRVLTDCDDTRYLPSINPEDDGNLSHW